MSSTTLVIVLVAIWIAFETGRRWTYSTSAKKKEKSGGGFNNAKLQEMERAWQPILTEGRVLTEDEQNRFRTFVDFRVAAEIAERDGRKGTWTFGDVAAAGELRKAKRQSAIELGEQIDAAMDAWSIHQFAEPRPPELDSMCKRWICLMTDIGEINTVRQVRQSDKWLKIIQ